MTQFKNIETQSPAKKIMFTSADIPALEASNVSLLQDLKAQKASIAMVGLGYVGLPIALEFAKDFKVIGFDIREDRVEKMNNGIDPSGELDSSAFANKKISFSASPSDLQDCRVFIVAVPTPVDEFHIPDIKALKSATQMVASVLKPGDYVVYESTVYPGCTEEVCVPILETVAGLEINKDFKVGYSPERINPGDKKNTLTSITKIVSGSDSLALKEIAELYAHIIQAGVCQATSIRVAEAAKVVENTQRDVNIALMNELSVIFNAMGISTQEVLAAAGTKWNFLNFFPGLVGGHCIGVDPYYLLHKAKDLGIDAALIHSARMANEWMPYSIMERIQSALLIEEKGIHNAKILCKGITFKENVSDVRNSKVAELVALLSLKGAQVDIVDPEADSEELHRHYGLNLCPAAEGGYDLVVMAVKHDAFLSESCDSLRPLFSGRPIIFDIRSMIEKVDDDVIYLAL